MFPNASNFREPAPMSAWFDVRMNGQQVIYAGQYDSLLRRFQSKARELLPVAYFFDREQGRCATGAIEAAAQLYGANLRRRDALTVDGRFGPETADALGFLLCATGQTDRAREWADAIRNGVIPGEFLRQMFWFSQFVREVGTPGSPGFQASVDGANITLPPTAVLPLASTIVASDPLDRDFFTAWRPGIDPVPVAPSVAAAGGQRPVAGPGPERATERRYGAAPALLAYGAAIAAGWWVGQRMRADKSKGESKPKAKGA